MDEHNLPPMSRPSVIEAAIAETLAAPMPANQPPVEAIQGEARGYAAVIPADREAWIQYEDFDGAFADRVRTGSEDNTCGLQIIARHRLAFQSEARAVPSGGVSKPIPMILYCPKCHEQHIDEPDEDAIANYDPLDVGVSVPWTNPPHRSHLCAACGCIWRPADVATEGVRSIKTAGDADTWGWDGASTTLSLPHQADREAIARIIDPECAVTTWQASGDEEHATRLKVCRERRKQWPPETPDDDCDQDGSCEECTFDMARERETPASKARRQIAFTKADAILALSPTPSAGRESQGLCDTTMTERFNRPCTCKTYAGNKGPCAAFNPGAATGQCVYCDHAAGCHTLPPATEKAEK